MRVSVFLCRIFGLLLTVTLVAPPAQARPRKPTPAKAHHAAAKPAKRHPQAYARTSKRTFRGTPRGTKPNHSRTSVHTPGKKRGRTSQSPARSRISAPEEAAPEPTPNLPPIEVHHDRKQHHASDPRPPTPPQEA